jgi:hypothetical protein
VAGGLLEASLHGLAVGFEQRQALSFVSSPPFSSSAYLRTWRIGIPVERSFVRNLIRSRSSSA